MGFGKWSIVALLVAAGPAWAQSQEEIEAGAGPQMTAYGHCLRDHVEDFAKADRNATDKQVIARANLACKEERKALWLQYQKPPLRMAPDEATRQLDEALDFVEPDMINIIRMARS